MAKMTLQQYTKRLKEMHGYRIKENLAFLHTVYGLWIQQIIEDANGFGLITVLNPLDGDVQFKLTDTGKKHARDYIRELNAKRKEILDAGKDSADETDIPTVEEIEKDINFVGIDEDGEYVNGWGVTDNYDADGPLLLKIGRDFEVA